MTIYWTEVKVGDIVKVNNEEFFPADLLLLSSRYFTSMSHTHVHTHTHTTFNFAYLTTVSLRVIVT